MYFSLETQITVYQQRVKERTQRSHQRQNSLSSRLTFSLCITSFVSQQKGKVCQLHHNGESKIIPCPWKDRRWHLYVNRVRHSSTFQWIGNSAGFWEVAPVTFFLWVGDEDAHRSLLYTILLHTSYTKEMLCISSKPPLPTRVLLQSLSYCCIDLHYFNIKII